MYILVFSFLYSQKLASMSVIFTPRMLGMSGYPKVGVTQCRDELLDYLGHIAKSANKDANKDAPEENITILKESYVRKQSVELQKYFRGVGVTSTGTVKKLKG